MNDIKEKVIELIVNNAKYEDEVTENTMLIEDMGFTSIELVAVVYDIETAFDISFDSDELDFDVINVVGNLIALVERKKGF